MGPEADISIVTSATSTAAVGRIQVPTGTFQLVDLKSHYSSVRTFMHAIWLSICMSVVVCPSASYVSKDGTCGHVMRLDEI